MKIYVIIISTFILGSSASVHLRSEFGNTMRYIFSATENKLPPEPKFLTSRTGHAISDWIWNPKKQNMVAGYVRNTKTWSIWNLDSDVSDREILLGEISKVS